MNHRSIQLRPRPATWATIALLAGFLVPHEVSAQSAVEVLEEFDMDRVTIEDEYYQQLFEVDVDYLLRLDGDRLMAGFRAVSMNQDPSTASGLYSGWEGGWSLLRGHTLGHYLTALAQAYRQTSNTDPTLNQQVQDRLDSMIADLRSYQQASGNGFLFASTESHFDVVEGRIDGDMWVPWYTMHKLIAGFIDVYELEGNPVALDIASSLGDWAYNRTAQWDDAMRSRVLGVEYGGMNDCLYDLYEHTGDPNHLTVAHLFDEESLFTPISQGNNVLNGLHANTQIPKIIGSLNRFRTLGPSEAFYFDTAEEFWTMVLEDHTYVTGGNSELEHFREPGQLDAYRDNTNNETCNSHNMMKLTRELFKITADPKYADFYERAFINEILSAIHPETGMTAYFKSMGTGYFKVFGGETDTFWCCNGTGMENYTKLNDGIYFHDDSDLYVNMYVSSTLDWDEKGFSISQSADVPLSPTISFSISAAPPGEVGVKFRVPWWLAKDELARITINGQVQCVQEEGGYFEVSRVWSAGDVVELTLPADVRASRLPDNQNAVAFTYGPVVLSAGLGTEQMVTEPQWASQKATIPDGVSIKETIAVQDGTIEDWLANIGDNLVQTPGSMEFTLRGTDEDDNLRFTPYYLRYEDRYGIYFEFQGEQGTAPAHEPDPTEVWTDCEGATDGTGGQGSGGQGSGGAAASGGASGTGAVTGTGGVESGSGGGAPTTGGDGSLATGGAVYTTGGATAADGGSSDSASDSSAGCGCSTPRRNSSNFQWILGALVAAALVRRRASHQRPGASA